MVGGGAAGLMAAGAAAQCGAEVVLLEKMKTPARKIRITGKGRCNLSNTAELSEFLEHFGKSGRFLRQAFGQFFSQELVAFLESRGLTVGTERGGRIFPENGGAPAVARLLLDWVAGVGVQVQTEAAVTGLLIREKAAVGVVCNGREIQAERVILATGGLSYPRTGSTGDGYGLAQAAGHSLVPTRPALVPLETNPDAVRDLAGLSLLNVNARLFVDGKKRRQQFGELGFTTTGVGGPIILTLSSLVVDALRAQRRVRISLDLKPALDDKKLDARLLRDLEQRTREPMRSVLRGLLPRELVPVCLRNAGIDAEQEAGHLTAAARKKIRLWLKDFSFEITGFRSYDEAIITAGGVQTSEIDPHTMESRITSGLYLVGELLDVQADTGGYNLQAAFSTGWVAGKAAAAELPNPAEL